MEEFKINRNSWHYKLNKNFLNDNGMSQHMMEYYWEPKVNNFCAYWRATIGRVIASLILTIAIIGLVGGIIFAFITSPMASLGFVGIGILFFVCVGILLFIMGAIGKAKQRYDSSDSLVVTKIKTYKSKICPSVSYGDGEK